MHPIKEAVLRYIVSPSASEVDDEALGARIIAALSYWYDQETTELGYIKLPIILAALTGKQDFYFETGVVKIGGDYFGPWKFEQVAIDENLTTENKDKPDIVQVSLTLLEDAIKPFEIKIKPTSEPVVLHQEHIDYADQIERSVHQNSKLSGIDPRVLGESLSPLLNKITRKADEETALGVITQVADVMLQCIQLNSSLTVLTLSDMYEEEQHYGSCTFKIVKGTPKFDSNPDQDYVHWKDTHPAAIQQEQIKVMGEFQKITHMEEQYERENGKMVKKKISISGKGPKIADLDEDDEPLNKRY